MSGSTRNNYTEVFFVSAGTELTDPLIIDIVSIAPDIQPQSKEIKGRDVYAKNPNFKQENNTIQAQNYVVSLGQQSEPSPKGTNKFLTNIWLATTNDTLYKIENVTYYLHPTFKPNTVTIHTRENNFGLSFTNWGIIPSKSKSVL